ncbi:GNAT family N-acetyltransferase [Paenibacillus sp. YYML68]|uniref:GNAT family N-acetyltransferase n=1 Tax=Paenibacillus sp. YYML68 TaxID=2909250 RepID=UPI00248FFED9|nr:GNAT family N-acetyltransferase [Paenibacillus sp. YYML68]
MHTESNIESAILIRQLTSDDVISYKSIRLQALGIKPEAFYRTLEEEEIKTLEDYSKLLKERSKENNFLLGAFLDGQLAGTIGFHNYEEGNLRHKGYIYGLYVIEMNLKMKFMQKLIEEVISRVKQLRYIRQIIATTVLIEELQEYKNLGFICHGIAPQSVANQSSFSDEFLLNFVI